MSSEGKPARATQPPAAAECPVDLELPPDATAPAAARATTRAALTRWHLPALLDSALLAVSELVTNVVRHGQPPARLRIARHPDGVTVDVHDASPHLPPTDPTPLIPHAESGRGLAIVAAVVDDLHVEQIPNDGKTVHALFHTDQP